MIKIKQTIETGYPHEEPLEFGECTHCGNEIYYGDEVIEHSGYFYDSKECLVEQMIKESNAVVFIAE